MNFSKSGLQLNYYRRANFKSRYLKTTLGTFFVKTIQDRALILGSYVPLVSFHSLNVAIFFFSIFMDEKVEKMTKWPIRATIFHP